MDITEFVSESLKQVIGGVVDAGKYAKEQGATVPDYLQRTQILTFDVAVTVVEGKGTGGKAGISVWSIGAGVTGKSESSSSTVSRIKFGMPIDLPTG